MSEREDVQEQSEELAVLPPAVVETFKRLMADIPVANTDEAMYRIVSQILAAEEPEELEEPWSGQGLRKLTGRLLRISSIKRLPSDFKDGVGWYLGCDATLVETGEGLFVSTGSLSILAQLGRAYQKGWLPLDVVAREAVSKSDPGRHPMHLEIVGRPKP